MDEYERAYLAGGDAVHRERRTSRSVFRIVSALSGVLGAVGALGIFAGLRGESSTSSLPPSGDVGREPRVRVPSRGLAVEERDQEEEVVAEEGTG